MRRLEVVLVFVVAVAGSLVPTLAAGGFVPAAVYAPLTATAVLAGVFVGRRYRAWGYCERSRDLLVRRGVLVKRLTVVPYGRMQLVDVTAGAVERMFGLATIKLHTAASATDARIPGLGPDEARRLRDRLADLGEAQAAGV